MKKILLSLLLTQVLMLGSCQKETETPGIKPIVLDQDSKSLLEADNAFAFEMFREIVKGEEKSENIMISPLSISLALAMTYNGADGDTRDAMEEVLHLQGFSPDEINSAYQTLINALLSIDPEVIMEIANSIWHRQDFSVREDFINVNKTYYNAEVSGLDFSSPSSVDVINQWVKNMTHDKIEKIIDEIKPEDVMFLINAIYFKGTWKYQFDENNTHDAPFYDESGALLQNVPTMMVKGTISYMQNENFEAVELPYSQGNYNMVILLPWDDGSVDDLLDIMNDETWKLWMNSFHNVSGMEVFLPKYKFEFEKELKEVLTLMGMGVAFSDQADFSKINPQAPLTISSVKHKTFIEVNEEGTEAAAVTSVSIVLLSAEIANEFRADHPFIFVIREKYTGAIMFMGIVADPGA